MIQRFLRLDDLDAGTASVSHYEKQWNTTRLPGKDGDIPQEARNTKGQIPFVIMLKKADGSGIDCKEYLFDAGMKKCISESRSPGKSGINNKERITMEQNQNTSSRLLTMAGGLMLVSGLLMAICGKLAYGGIFCAAAGCMLIAAYNFRQTENKKQEKEKPDDEQKTV